MSLNYTKSVLSAETALTQLGRAESGCYVNPPIVRASTVLAESLAQWRDRAALPSTEKPISVYARFGTPTTQAFENAIAELESAHRALAFPSGLAACTMSLLALAPARSHVLMSASVYWPMRDFARYTLAALDIEVEFFHEIDVEGFARRLRKNTSVVYLESPGSVTFEVQDVGGIAAAAHARGAWVVMDNTWASPLLFRPLEHGVDVSVQSATKYICGHSDCVLGVAACNERAWPALSAITTRFGQTASPDDLYQGLRGLRTLGVRLRQHEETATALVHWLARRPEVLRVLSPILPEHPGHSHWRRLYSGSSGLFSFVLRPVAPAAMDAFFGQLRVFGIGLSWGGFESLMVPITPSDTLCMRGLEDAGPLIRVHAGLESVEDLVRDLQGAFDAMQRQVPAEACTP